MGNIHNLILHDRKEKALNSTYRKIQRLKGNTPSGNYGESLGDGNVDDFYLFLLFVLYFINPSKKHYVKVI